MTGSRYEPFRFVLMGDTRSDHVAHSAVIEAVRDAGVDVVATECPCCVMQLRDMIAQAGLDVAVMSVAELLALGRREGAAVCEARGARACG